MADSCVVVRINCYLFIFYVLALTIYGDKPSVTIARLMPRKARSGWNTIYDSLLMCAKLQLTLEEAICRSINFLKQMSAAQCHILWSTIQVSAAHCLIPWPRDPGQRDK